MSSFCLIYLESICNFTNLKHFKQSSLCLQRGKDLPEASCGLAGRAVSSRFSGFASSCGLKPADQRVDAGKQRIWGRQLHGLLHNVNCFLCRSHECLAESDWGSPSRGTWNGYGFPSSRSTDGWDGWPWPNGATDESPRAAAASWDLGNGPSRYAWCLYSYSAE